MYELWLIINTFYELTMMNIGLVLLVLVIWLALMVAAGMKKNLPWCKGFVPALVVAVPVWIVSFAMMPGWTKSSFDNVTYILDYMVVAGLAAAFAGLVAVFVWPLYLLIRR